MKDIEKSFSQKHPADYFITEEKTRFINFLFFLCWGFGIVSVPFPDITY